MLAIALKLNWTKLLNKQLSSDFMLEKTVPALQYMEQVFG